MNSKELLGLTGEIESIIERIPKTSGVPDLPRWFAIARTHLETAQLFIEKASDMVP